MMEGKKKKKKEVVKQADSSGSAKKNKKQKEQKAPKEATEEEAPKEEAPAANLTQTLFGGSKGGGGALANLFAAPNASKFTHSKVVEEQKAAEVAAKVAFEADPEANKPDPDDEPVTAAKKDEKYVIRPKISSAQKNAEAEKLKRTVFVGNVPADCIQKPGPLKAVFLLYGAIQSVRFRSIAFAEGTKHRRSAVITKADLGNRSTCNAYVVFKDAESAAKAAKDGNGAQLQGKVLRCDMATTPGKHEDLSHGDHRKGVFVGNLPFDVEEDQLRRHFDGCGEISNVRVVRDRGSNLGKGIAFVQFSDRDAVALAVELHESKVGSRVIRVNRLKKQGDTGGKHTRAPASAPGANKRPRYEEGQGPSGYQGEYQADIGTAAVKKKKKSMAPQMEGIKAKKGKKSRDPAKREARQARRQAERKQK